MRILTKRICYGPGRFVPAGVEIDLPDPEAHDLVNKDWAAYVDQPFPPAINQAVPTIETAMRSTGPENAKLPRSTRIVRKD